MHGEAICQPALIGGAHSIIFHPSKEKLMQKEKYVTFLVTAGAVVMTAQAWAAQSRVPATPSPLTNLTVTRPALEEGGIAGVAGLTQNFETGFTAGSGCNQNGWVCNVTAGVPPLMIVQHAPVDPVFGAFSASYTTSGNPAGFLFAFASPTTATPETGRVDFDVLINNSTTPYSVETEPCTVAGCLINTRLTFATSGSIDVLQLLPMNCMNGQFVPSGATWTAGVKARIGIEVDGAGALRIYKDNALIFTGQDISVSCAPTGPQGIAAITWAVDNTVAGTTLTFDNIAQGGGGGNPCLGNIVNSGTSVNRVDVDDLLAVIGQWGPCPAPPTGCPANIVNTGTSINRVDVDDLLFVITHWGACP
jgi:hypothetical protein